MSIHLIKEAQMKVTEYNLKASNGRHIRKATKVTFPDGYEVRFIERMPKGEAVKQAEAIRARD
jgi:hypothetical protein